MSDKVYLPDSIPEGFIYGQYSNGYITLYNQPSAQNETIQYYRIYYGYSDGLVTSGTSSFGSYNRTYFESIPTSREVFDRPDFVNILTCVFLMLFCGIWLLNVMTSLVRKGGVFGGLI